MSIVALVPRGMLEKKPRHGEACNRCGLCCHAQLCNVAQAIHGRRQGPCPELKWDDDGSRCGLIDRTAGDEREDAKLLINAGAGCDMILRGEERNRAYTAQLDAQDLKNFGRLEAARRRFDIPYIQGSKP